METPISYSRFGGLRLDLPLDEVGPEEAIDLLDVDWDPGTGALRTRPGLSEFGAKEAAAVYNRLFAHSEKVILARRAKTLTAILAESTEELASTIEVSESHLSFAHITLAPLGYTVIADREHTLRAFQGIEFSAPKATVDGTAEKAMPIGYYVVAWPEGGYRLMVCGTTEKGGPGGATSSGSHVWFSEPANGKEWNTAGTAEHPANYVQVSPGDEEEIVGVCRWNGQVFVFKQTKMFVFYSVSTDEEGDPEFNFREVDLGTRIQAPGEKGNSNVVAGQDGVYFISADGLFLTTGQSPVLISQAMAGLASANTEGTIEGPAITTFGNYRWSSNLGIEYNCGAIYVGLGFSGFSERLLKYDLATGRWTVWKVKMNAMASWKRYSEPRPQIFASPHELKRLSYFSGAVATDPTVVMEPRWQSGFYDLGSADEKTLNAVRLFGKGTVSMKVAREMGSLGSATTQTLTSGSTPGEISEKSPAQALFNKAQTAVLFSHQLSGEEGKPFIIFRLTRYLRENLPPGTKS